VTTRPSPSPSHPASPSPGVPDTAEVAARFHNAPFLSDLLAVLNHPASATTPDLKHFRLQAAAVARARAEAAQGRRLAEGNRLNSALLVGAWVLAAGVLLGLHRLGRRLPRRLRRAGLLAIPSALAAMSTGLGAAPTPAVAPAPAPVARVVEASPSPSPAPSLGPDWDALVALETQLARNQDSVAQQESIIRAAAADPAAVPVPVDVGGDPSNGDRNIRLDTEAQDQRKLARLLDAYHAAVASYQESLRQEYDFYRGAAQDPVRKQKLVAAAIVSPRPEVRDAVTYNLSLVQAQLDQENAINAAEAKLAAIGSLSGSQLAAIRHHQAFIIPVEAPIIQGFGPTDFGLEPSITFHGTFYPHFHTGLDLVGPENAPVHAAADGVVLLANSSRDSQGHYTGYGNYVVIAHPDGFVTLYGHLNAFSVKEGDVVHQGQIVGQEGSTGMSTGPHVHFEIRHGGEWVDPEPYLTGQKST
jgi:murein DD-endopeptidase MepM/ murein hydrolase activator NlpD